MEIVGSISANGFAGRMDLVRPHIADDFLANIPSSMPNGGEYRGWQGYLDMLGAFADGFQDFTFMPVQLAAAGDKVFILSHLDATLISSAKTISMPFCEVWALANEQVLRITPFFYDTRQILDLR